MKEFLNKNNSYKLFQVFLRFLKINGVYYKFMLSHKKCCKIRDLPSLNFKTDNINDIIERYDVSTIRDIFLHGYVVYWEPSDEKFWVELDQLWYKFYYKNKIYSNYIK